jgi:hypothetical protein
MHTVTAQWQMQQRSYFNLGTMILDMLLFSDDQVLCAKSDDELQMATLQLSNIMAAYNLEISHDEMKFIAFCGKYQLRSKIILNSQTIEQIQIFNNLGCDTSFNYDRDLSQKIYKFSICMWYYKENIKK